ncbi:MAG: DUF106 domain-containing protein [Candidatus Thorarchaeota archaeon]|nr:DUF106 domain-containing protein [Candidatus Thorarchaeota archaeon]
MDVLGDIASLTMQLLDLVSRPPYSAVFVAFVSVLIALFSTWSTVRFTDMEQLRSDMAEVKAWQQKLGAARKTMDPVLLQEVMDGQSHIMTIQARMMSARMKPMCIFYIPFIIIFWMLSLLYQGTPVAILPFNAQKWLFFIDGWLGTSQGVTGGFGLYFLTWYLIVSFSFGSLIRKWAKLDYM